MEPVLSILRWLMRVSGNAAHFIVECPIAARMMNGDDMKAAANGAEPKRTITIILGIGIGRQAARNLGSARVTVLDEQTSTRTAFRGQFDSVRMKPGEDFQGESRRGKLRLVDQYFARPHSQWRSLPRLNPESQHVGQPPAHRCDGGFVRRQRRVIAPPLSGTRIVELRELFAKKFFIRKVNFAAACLDAGRIDRGDQRLAGALLDLVPCSTICWRRHGFRLYGFESRM